MSISRAIKRIRENISSLMHPEQVNACFGFFLPPSACGACPCAVMVGGGFSVIVTGGRTWYTDIVMQRKRDSGGIKAAFAGGRGMVCNSRAFSWMGAG